MKLNLLDIQHYKNLEFLARQLVEGFITGLHKSPYHGFSVEFAEHQLYNTGESTRHIDWKVFARTDKLFTKRFEEETNLRCQLVIDNSSSMYYPKDSNGKIRFSIMASAAIAFLLQKQRDAVGLVTFSDKIEVNTQIKSTSSHLNKLFITMNDLLENKQENKTSSVGKVLDEIAEKVHKRSLVVIFSDMFDKSSELDEIFGALQHLKHNRHEVLVFHVTDRKTEYHFDFDERPHEFIDLESGERLKIQPSQVKESFEKEMQAYYHELKIRCGQLKIDFVEADVNEDFNHILYTFLMKRAKMR
jgi:uncharacterized protein (DUF58 family)